MITMLKCGTAMYVHPHIVLSELSSLVLSPEEVVNILKSLPVGKAVGPDGVSNRLLKQLAELLTCVFNESLAKGTVMILSFQTDRSGQTVQTQINLIRVYTVCNSGCIFCVHYSLVKPSCSNFRVIAANFWGVRVFRNFTVVFLKTGKNPMLVQFPKVCLGNLRWR